MLGVNQKVLLIRKEPMPNAFLTLNAQSIFPHAGNRCYEAKIEENGCPAVVALNTKG